jgi:hypothetical protein
MLRANCAARQPNTRMKSPLGPFPLTNTASNAPFYPPASQPDVAGWELTGTPDL